MGQNIDAEFFAVIPVFRSPEPKRVVFQMIFICVSHVHGSTALTCRQILIKLGMWVYFGQ